ncbi:hypothetical protein F2Q69_00033469 [Brassica cretica]|uniref:Uncharacterized protein n=1 Tax=Brassica cretica TaxID=69181 RepID=A0A8S9SMG4_BRACR|nr:hypothetical protein F2Q69_00033469 [Brassica cretica]
MTFGLREGATVTGVRGRKVLSSETRSLSTKVDEGTCLVGGGHISCGLVKGGMVAWEDEARSRFGVFSDPISGTVFIEPNCGTVFTDPDFGTVYEKVVAVKESRAEKGLELVGGVFNGGKFWGESGEEGSGGSGGTCSPVATDGGSDWKHGQGLARRFALEFVTERPSFLVTMTYITPCAQARGEDIMRRVNYASAAARVREETGRQLGDWGPCNDVGSRKV